MFERCGQYLHCLANNAAVRSFPEDRGAELRPVSLGHSTKGGCEAVAHAARRYLTNLPPHRIFLKIYMCNAFHCLRRNFFGLKYEGALPVSICSSRSHTPGLLICKMAMRPFIQQLAFNRVTPSGHVFFPWASTQ